MEKAFKFCAPFVFVVLWSTGFIGARFAMPNAEPFSFLSVRFIISALLIYALWLVFRGSAISHRTKGHAIIAGVLMHGFYLCAVFWAVRQGMPAGVIALIIGLQPLITAFGAYFALNETLLGRHWLGLLVGFAGVFLVLWPKLGVDGSGINGATLGAGFFAVAAIVAGSIWQKRFLQNEDLLAVTCWQYVGGALVSLVGAFMFETGSYTLNGALIFAMVWLVFVLSIGAVLLYMLLINEGAVSRVSLLFFLVPSCTALIAWVLVGETLNLIQLIGMAITTLGIGVAMGWMEKLRYFLPARA